ncbi:MAG: carboxypeptidase regulatory-like domain-containing protein, partial [Alistipes sp.]|nr:carboxypeptidase regulatory-like domain-containing protein [Alistipes sp.]
MKKFFSTILFLCIAVGAYAQSGRITMTVVDAASKSGVVGAVVEIYNVNKPDDKKYFTTGEDGKITIPSRAYGDYEMVITYIGYEDKKVPVKIDSETEALGNVELAESTTRIETVTKTVQAIRASQSGDTISYNADAFKVASDADVEGLLKKMPGIQVSDGQVTAQGEAIQKIFVDGKEFFGDDVATAISTLPAQIIQSIEVFNKLSDQAEFSGRDDGDSYKALNLITRAGMRQGVFGKVYGGYGYQPETDRVTDHNKYMIGGNVNIFNGDSRTTVTGLLNNINQQNFSFQDILGVAGGGMGGRGGGMGGGFMRGRQGGIANVASLGLNYSNNWKDNKIKLQASYFYNRTRSKNLNEQTTWYEAPLENMGTKEQSAFSDNKNYNHRFNDRFDWRLADNQSIMTRTNFSF